MNKEKGIIWAFFNKPTWTMIGLIGWMAWYQCLMTEGIIHWLWTALWMIAFLNWSWRSGRIIKNK